MNLIIILTVNFHWNNNYMIWLCFICIGSIIIYRAHCSLMYWNSIKRNYFSKTTLSCTILCSFTYSFISLCFRFILIAPVTLWNLLNCRCPSFLTSGNLPSLLQCIGTLHRHHLSHCNLSQSSFCWSQKRKWRSNVTDHVRLTMFLDCFSAGWWLS